MINNLSLKIILGVYVEQYWSLPVTQPVPITRTRNQTNHTIEQLHKQLHYVRLIGMCGKCPIATIQIIITFNYTDGQTAKPLRYGNRLS